MVPKVIYYRRTQSASDPPGGAKARALKGLTLLKRTAIVAIDNVTPPKPTKKKVIGFKFRAPQGGPG